MLDKETILLGLKQLNSDFKNTKKNNPNSITEEKIRSGFLNKLFELFGWNLSDISEVVEEKHIKGLARKNLKSIGSKHSKPDYYFCENGIDKLVFDAKNVTEDFKNSKEYAFQIRSYSWSMNLPIAMMSNFETFGVYDTTFVPNVSQDSTLRAIFFSIEDLIKDFDTYSTFFDKKNIQQHNWKLPSEIEISLKKGNIKTLDDAFFELLESFRLSLGNGILDTNPDIGAEKLNYYTQIIINRILFIRILEDLGLETSGTIRSYLDSENFWKQFSDRTTKDFELKYDGALFSEPLPSFILNNDIFESFIISITDNTPYRFDVIKSSFIAEIYDQFLGRQLSFDKGDLTIINKPLSPEGSVPTPHELSRYICEQTIQLNTISSISDLYKIKILDPCVGSGSFLLSSLDLLVDKYKKITNKSTISFIEAKNIIQQCLFGVDIDQTALEVLKMTLSLKLITSDFLLPEPLENLLSDITHNFKFGNTIVQSDARIPDVEEFGQTPTTFSELFPSIFSGGGFDFIVTNPPYVEPKHFKKKWPNTFNYLKEKYNFNEKVDISMFFYKRLYDLLNPNGRYGIVIQKRFFNAVYGQNMRNFLSDSKTVISIHDFDDNDIFKGKTTYIACLFGRSNKNIQLSNPEILYAKHSLRLNKTRSNLKQIIETESKCLKVDHLSLKDRNWSLESLQFSKILQNKIRQSSKFNLLGDIKRINIGVGPQVLDSKFYFLHDVIESNDDNVQAVNRRNEKLEIEKGILKPLVRNDHPESYNLSKKTKDYIIFPYDDNGNLIPIKDLAKNFPNAYVYLKYMNENSTTEKVSNEDEFYRYTRETRLNSFSRPKIFIPMTIKEVTASFVEKNYFGDNSNINTIIDSEDDIQYLKALCIIFNSSIFNKLAIILSGEARGGYRKLNKQFLKLIPIPVISEATKLELAKEYNDIVKLKSFIQSSSGEKQNSFDEKLTKKLKELDTKINNLYNFDSTESGIINSLIERT
ncbi:TPA: N-6 DNA methylase [Streptococcus suis]|nr:N-6 DNA methylase [Streptococcus suis]